MLTQEEIAEARRLWALGKSTNEIAKALNVEERLVYNGRPYRDIAYLALPGTIQPNRNISKPRPVVIVPTFGQKQGA